ncbi:MAG: domain containing protein [Deltaproteobacteria bacterium]|nr:domain containing protein [Deltaproteobacteria bacterium]
MTMQCNGKTPLWAAGRTLLNERGDDFNRRLVTVLRTFDPEAIHDLRVSSRRMREGLVLFTPCYPAGDMARLVKGTRRVTRLLGDIRNSDEALLFFTSLRDRLDDCCRRDLDLLVTAFQKERKNELRKLEAGLRKIAAADLHDRYRQVINFPSLFAPAAGGLDLFAPLADFAKGALSSRLEDVLQLVPEAKEEGNIAAQHQLRIAVKHFRYRLEILSLLLDSSYRKFYGTVKEYQEVLGRMHDLDVFAALSREAAWSQPATVIILKAIATQRGRLFAGFTAMLAKMPFEKIGTRMRSAL